MANNEKFNCPHCGSDNTVSVPLAYKRGHATGTATHMEVVGYDVQTTTTTYSSGYSETHETGRTPIYGPVKHDTYTITDLAAEVSPPEEPTKPVMKEKDGFIVFIEKCVVAFITYHLAIFLGGCISWTTDNEGLQIWVLWIILGIVFYKTINKAWDAINKKQYKFELEMQKYNEELTEYNMKINAWNKSYICMRCGHRFYLDETYYPHS